MEKTNKNINVRLTDADWKILGETAGLAGLTIGELITAFAQDLVASDYRNGSDETDYAVAWYDRCGFTILDKSLLSYLTLEGEDVSDFLTTYDEYLYVQANAELHKDDTEEDGTFWAQTEVNRILTEYAEDRKVTLDSSRVEKEVNLCRRWLEEFNK